MHDRHARPDPQCLFDLASSQGGFFTAGQARDCGYSRSLLSHHAGAGKFKRTKHGLYRFVEFPSSPHEEVIAAWLATGKDGAIVSHESALDLLALSDVIPDSIHITVPRARRYRTSFPGVTIHTTTREIQRSNTTVVEGIRISNATRSIVDSAEYGTAPEQVIRAVEQALDRGLTTRSRLLDAARKSSSRARALIRDAIDTTNKR
jgi:predicted transcriptional regulator of viral defense system